MVSTQQTIQADPLVRGGRMVVFVPGMLENPAGFARQIYNQALIQQRGVVYLALNGQANGGYTAGENAAARQLATITALTQASEVRATTQQVKASDWAEALRQVTQPGDLVIWPEERLLAPASLERELGISQKVLPWCYAPAEDRDWRWYHALIFWLSGLALLVGFTYLEFSAAGLLSSAPLKMALIILFTLEAGAFYLWNSIFSRARAFESF